MSRSILAERPDSGAVPLPTDYRRWNQACGAACQSPLISKPRTTKLCRKFRPLVARFWLKRTIARRTVAEQPVRALAYLSWRVIHGIPPSGLGMVGALWFWTGYLGGHRRRVDAASHANDGKGDNGRDGDGARPVAADQVRSIWPAEQARAHL